MHSNAIYYVNTYKSRTVDFKRLPPKLVVSIPKFSFQRIDREKLFKQFGSLTAFSIKTEERKPIGVESSRTASSSINRPLLLKPQTLATIETGYDHLHDVTCLSDEQIWTLGNNNVMKLFNLNGKLRETFHTNLGNQQSNISITRSGEIAFTDKSDCTVNIVKNKQIQEIVKLQGWMSAVLILVTPLLSCKVMIENTQKLYAMLVPQKYKVFNLITEENLCIHLAFYATLSTLVRTETAIFVLLVILPGQ